MRLSAGCLALALVACRGGESEDPPVHLIHNMDTQEKGKAYRKDTSGLFPNGRLMQNPIEGTVAVGELHDDSMFDDGIDLDPTTADGGRLGKPAATFKFPAQVQLPDGGIDEAFVERGHLRYNIYCTPCHGVGGNGQGPVAGKAFDGGLRLEVPPRDLTAAAAKDYPVGQIYASIKHGVNAGNMPSYATQIPVADRWAISAYVLRLQGRTFDGKPPEPPPDMNGPASVAIGKYVYKARGCNACHSLDGTKVVGPSWLGVWGKTEKTSGGEVTVNEAYIRESINEPKAKVVDGFQPVMPPPTPPLEEKELKSIVLFIESLKS
ncbi:MAG: c-type cytochrome [Archangiaceae bacterium]|nr:c-type cytochrome [Archangiaceae bacterium]